MWQYEKKLQYPVNIKTPNPKLAKIIISQLGGPDGELSASLRYLNQRYAMPYPEVKGLLTDIGVSLTKLHSAVAKGRHLWYTFHKKKYRRGALGQDRDQELCHGRPASANIRRGAAGL